MKFKKSENRNFPKSQDLEKRNFPKSQDLEKLRYSIWILPNGNSGPRYAFGYFRIAINTDFENSKIENRKFEN